MFLFLHQLGLGTPETAASTVILLIINRFWSILARGSFSSCPPAFVTSRPPPRGRAHSLLPLAERRACRRYIAPCAAIFSAIPLSSSYLTRNRTVTAKLEPSILSSSYAAFRRVCHSCALYPWPKGHRRSSYTSASIQCDVLPSWTYGAINSPGLSTSTKMRKTSIAPWRRCAPMCLCTGLITPRAALLRRGREDRPRGFSRISRGLSMTRSTTALLKQVDEHRNVSQRDSTGEIPTT